MSTIPIVFAFDSNYALPASIALQSLMDSKHADTHYNVYVLHNNLPLYIKKKIEAITCINWIQVDDTVLQSPPVTPQWNIVVYYRILIPLLLPDIYDKVIFSDVDVLFQKDLTEVFSMNITSYQWAGVIAEKNNPEMVIHTYFPENKKEFIYMAGFMVMNLKKMRDENIVQKSLDNIMIFQERLKMCDLDVLNLTCPNIASVPFDYSVLENIYDENAIQDAFEYEFLSRVYSDEILHTAKKYPAIIHYAGGRDKIWNRPHSIIPQYYWYYIENSPLYRPSRYFPKCTTYVYYYCIYGLSKITFVKSWRRTLKNTLKKIMIKQPR